VNRTLKILAGLAVAVTFFVASAYAEYDPQRMIANIPFEFTVGRTSLPAGQYDFLRTGPNAVLVRDADGRGVMTVSSGSMHTNGSPKQSTLKFAIVNGRYVLVQIWNEPAGRGSEFPVWKSAAITAPVH
jgi:hypothetical protein